MTINYNGPYYWLVTGAIFALGLAALGLVLI